MARYNPHHETAAIYDVVETWRDRCLVGDGALLADDETTWSPDTASAVCAAFNGSPDTGPDTFLEKLQRQLSGLGDSAVQLAAEALYVMLLFPSNIGPERKRQNIRTILSWRDAPARLREGIFDTAVLGGIGSAGGGYNQNRPFEFGYFLELLVALKSLQPAERQLALADPWSFARFLTRVNAPGRQLSHILEHLLFPDTFERISSGADKRRVILGLTGDDPKTVKAMDREARDRRLLALRSEIAATRGDPNFDFYDEDFAPRWRNPGEAHPNTNAAADAENASVWAEVTSLEHGHGGPGWELGQWLWSPTTSKDGADRYSVMRLPRPGDRVFHFVAGLTPNSPRRRFLWGRSRVKASPVEVTERPSAPGAWGEAEAYYKIAVENLEQFETPIPMEEVEARHGAIILHDLEGRPKHYPYIRYGDGFRGAQGIYLAKLTPALTTALDVAFDEPTRREARPQVGVPFSLDDAMADLFLPRAEVESILELWRAKSNVILQGAPGVGKSFIAKRLAYLIIGAKDPDRVETVQFHQSYAYEDFVQGYRPTEDRSFELRDGVFLRHCARAQEDPSRDYVLIIDEINRGNLSKIFGELMLLVEHDKRGSEWEARLAYARPGDAPFSVPPNLFIVGMMNTADRSLSMVDYALRRRFAFWTLRPQFASTGFRDHLAAKGAVPAVVDRIVQRMAELNEAIASDTLNLGSGFEIGHSFFVPGKSGAYGEDWYARVMRTEILPLLGEYWFDDRQRAEGWRDRLLATSS